MFLGEDETGVGCVHRLGRDVAADRVGEREAPFVRRGTGRDRLKGVVVGAGAWRVTGEDMTWCFGPEVVNVPEAHSPTPTAKARTRIVRTSLTALRGRRWGDVTALLASPYDRCRSGLTQTPPTCGATTRSARLSGHGPGRDHWTRHVRAVSRPSEDSAVMRTVWPLRRSTQASCPPPRGVRHVGGDRQRPWRSMGSGGASRRKSAGLICSARLLTDVEPDE